MASQLLHVFLPLYIQALPPLAYCIWPAEVILHIVALLRVHTTRPPAHELHAPGQPNQDEIAVQFTLSTARGISGMNEVCLG